MSFPLTPVFAGVVVSAVLSTVLAYFVWQERPKAGATSMATAAAGVALWGYGQVIALSGEVVVLFTVGMALTYLGQALVQATWYVFCHEYTGQYQTVPRRTVLLLSIWPVTVTALALTNPVHELVWTDLATTGGDSAFAFTATPGPVKYVHILIALVLVIGGSRHLVRKFFASRNVYRTRTALFLLIAATVLTTAAISVYGVSPLPLYTLTPLVFLGLAGFSFLSVASNRFMASLPIPQLLAMFGSHSKNLTPAARDTAIEEMGNGFIVTDHKNRIVDVNPMGKLIFGHEGERIVGKRLDELLPPEAIMTDDEELLEPDVTGQYSGVWVGSSDGLQRCFDVTISPLDTDDDGELTGRVGLVHDVTDRERRKQKLEEQTQELRRQNEQLDSFANIVSHDLRNPINVASGRLEIIDSETDSVDGHVQKAQDSLKRMEDIISDVLTLARLGQTLDETEPVDIQRLTGEAWDHVATEDATLENDITLTVDGSKSHLLQVFENLFRNAVEHGHDGITITVGECNGGFFVEDDGPGIPEEHRDKVLEEGYTTNENGTGFGLSIVSTIIEAHGWDIEVMAGIDGGARFEITRSSTHAEDDVPAAAG